MPTRKEPPTIRLLRSKLNYANVATTLAIVLALGGTSYAAAAVTGQDDRNGTLTGADIRDGRLRATELDGGTPLAPASAW